MKKFIKFFTGLLFLFIFAETCSAQLLAPGGGAMTQLESNTQKLSLSGGLGHATVGSIIAGVIQAVLGLLAAIFLVLMIMAGFQWMTAAGNETQVQKATDTIKTAVIGLVIVLAAYAITYFIFTNLPFGGVGGSGNGGLSGTPAPKP